MTIIGSRPRAALLALHLLAMGMLGVSAPAAAMQILDAADHAELAAEISATDVSRIALAGDRIAKVVRSPDGFAVEHDAASGDLYLKPLAADAAEYDPVTLFVGTERGFTYRLTLTPSDRDSAQILIRNAAALPGAGLSDPVDGGPHVAALVRLVRAVARRDLLPGYAVHAGGEALQPGLTLIETWRGPRFVALVFEAARPASPGSRLGVRDRSWSGAGDDAGGAWPPGSGSGTGSLRSGPAGLAGTIGRLPGIGRTADGVRLAALWLAPPDTGPSGGRLGVAVVEAAGAGGPQ